jgi:hypothetical protein
MKIQVNKKQKKVIKKIFLAGILLRLLIMPFFAHGDIIAVHKRVESIVCGSKTIWDYGAVGTHLIESIFATLFKPVVPCSILSGIQQSFYNAPKLPRMLFFFKLPYMLFEIGFWYLMWQFIKDKNSKWKKRIAVFLAFNPVIIFSVYLFGRFEPYNLFLSGLILFILNKLKNKRVKLLHVILISLIMAFTISVRKSYMLILPALVASLGAFSKWGILNLGLTTGFFTLIGLLKNLANNQQINQQMAVDLASSNWVQKGMHPNYIFQGAIDISQGRLLYIFFILLGIILMWWLQNSEVVKEKLSRPTSFSLFSVLILVSYYATSIFHPQYYTWFIPFFLILIINKESKFLLHSFYWSFPFYLFWNLSWGNYTTFGLLFAVSTAFKQIEPGWYLPLYPTIKWSNIGRSILSGINLYWIYYLLKGYGQEKAN